MNIREILFKLDEKHPIRAIVEDEQTYDLEYFLRKIENYNLEEQKYIVQEIPSDFCDERRHKKFNIFCYEEINGIPFIASNRFIKVIENHEVKK